MEMLVKIPDTGGSVTTTVLNTKIRKGRNKIPDSSNLVYSIVLNTKIGKVENKIPNHPKYINNQEFSKLTGETFAARLEEADLVSKNDFDNKFWSEN